MLSARVVLGDPLGAKAAAGAAAVLALVLLWHAVSMVRQGRGRHWTCWSAGLLAAATVPWLIAMLTGAADAAWARLGLLGLLAVAAAILFYHAVFGYLGPVRLGLLLVLRCLAIGVLVLLLFKPALGRKPAPSDRPLLAVLLDRSRSMDEADGPDRRPRFTAAVDAILADQTRLESFFDVRYFAFDRTAQPVEHAGQLADQAPTGSATWIDAALAGLAPLLSNERAEGVVLISDGIHNGPGSAVASADSLPRPVFTVGVGGPAEEGQGARDVAIERVSAPEQVFGNTIAAVSVDVRSQGYAGRSATAVLRGADGEELARAEVRLADGVVPVALEFSPRRLGVMELDIELAALEGEALAENNRHRLAVRVGEQRIKVFYAEGSIRSEYRYLVDALMGDRHVELMTLLQRRRTGEGSAEFVVRGSVGGRTLGGMPATAEQFALFDVFIIGDLDRSYLSDAQLGLLAEAVRGGKGLLMIGGSHSLGPGGYGGTEVEKMLPVELGPRTIGQETMPFALTLTAAGKVHPIFAGLADLISPPPDRPPSPLPELKGCVRVVRAKPTGQVLAVHPARRTPDGSDPLAVLTVQPYGAGRTAAFTADTTWQWKMFRTVAAYQAVHERFWGQLVRWLASSEQVDDRGQSAAVLNLPRSYFAPGEAVELAARVWDAADQPAADAEVQVRLTAPDGQASVLELTGVADRPGHYQARWTPPGAGAYTLAMTASKSAVSLGASERSIEVGQPGAEAARRSADIELLQALAARRPGRVVEPYVPIEQYPRLVEQLTARYQQLQSVAGPERTWPQYTNSVYGLAMLTFVALLSLEWLLRRRWQLQ